jgi:hypothetical protein
MHDHQIIEQAQLEDWAIGRYGWHSETFINNPNQ